MNTSFNAKVGVTGSTLKPAAGNLGATLASETKTTAVAQNVNLSTAKVDISTAVLPTDAGAQVAALHGSLKAAAQTPAEPSSADPTKS